MLRRPELLGALMVSALLGPALAAERTLEIAHSTDELVISDGPQRCAAFDVHVLTLLEEHAEAREVAPDDIVRAAFALVAARQLCVRGRTREAMRAYADIALDQPQARWFR
ncbi:MAG TPA: hypothetical protein VIL65_16920 [Beijerinckiaceae bacterium]|jgi:hypothetical protein